MSSHRFMRPSRRAFLAGGTAFAASLAAPSISRASARPVFTHGVQSGDVDTMSGMIWTRTDRPARVMMEVSTTESFANARQLAPLTAGPSNDFAVKRMVDGLPSDQDIFYRFVAADLNDLQATSDPIVGQFRTAPTARRDVRFAWSGDTAGQGWGIDDEGMRTYATMAQHRPDFFIHSGDTIYADGPMQDEVEKDGQLIWKNATLIDEKRKVAETLDEFRGQWKYNMMDEHVREMNALCPTFFQWDDHEVVNNWSDSKDLSGDDRYTEKNVHVLAARSAKAFHEMTPISYTPAEPGRVYRKIGYGPMLDVFFLDLRSYRAGNSLGLQENPADEATTLLGAEQIAWLKRELVNSSATWKVIACDMPIGLVVRDGERVEAISNGDDGSAKGREFEIADLLRFIKTAKIDNTVWFTADVHYTAAHYYNPDKAAFQDFEPFWEFVSGPLHAGTFGPNALDGTFGPEVKFVKAPTEEQGANLPPSMGLQFFGLVDIDGATQQMTVRLMDRADQELWKITLDPKGASI
ncbi:alkaline phosphatase D family protein [Phaeobacter gallaeciensis]|uniref:alkaline phosphatase D family protein n=1 Tax=Phaeobacter gallaeciensis TaxID=60890 RepID=UPI00238082B3|nr:alkaline phosphatase D family protein [Phaeobacter gallaeciensis]MDE4275284.1 alkaline phosphatase D family protein [Phaeobacter gallaeciensis]MDE4300399.1 alkaline phosphatase D family protein [Phaeobacter gallaeciensis]MDE5185563.1 alkaline phosphatase D family protein [Phaeobacter gallaeciensis]